MTLATADLSEAWRGLEAARLAGWFLQMTGWFMDTGWNWTATRIDGRRFRTIVRSASRDPVEAIDRLLRECEREDDARA